MFNLAPNIEIVVLPLDSGTKAFVAGDLVVVADQGSDALNRKAAETALRLAAASGIAPAP